MLTPETQAAIDAALEAKQERQARARDYDVATQALASARDNERAASEAESAAIAEAARRKDEALAALAAELSDEEPTPPPVVTMASLPGERRRSVLQKKAQEIARVSGLDPLLIIGILTALLKALAACYGGSTSDAVSELRKPRRLAQLRLRRELRKHGGDTDALEAAVLDAAESLTVAEATELIKER